MHIIILGVTKYIIQDIIPRKNEGKTTYHSRRIFIECIPKLQNTGKINQIIKVLIQNSITTFNLGTGSGNHPQVRIKSLKTQTYNLTNDILFSYTHPTP